MKECQLMKFENEAGRGHWNKYYWNFTQKKTGVVSINDISETVKIISPPITSYILSNGIVIVQGAERKWRQWSTLSENFMSTVHQNGEKWNLLIEQMVKVSFVNYFARF